MWAETWVFARYLDKRIYKKLSMAQELKCGFHLSRNLGMGSVFCTRGQKHCARVDRNIGQTRQVAKFDTKMFSMVLLLIIQ